VILTYNRLHHLISCLDSVYAQDYPPEYVEVIIVDDASTDGTSDFIESFRTSHANVSYVRHTENKGVAATRNTGILHARNEFICILADDYILPRQYLQNANHFFTLHPDGQALRFIIRPVNNANYWMRLNYLYLDYAIKTRIRGQTGFFMAELPASGAVIFHKNVFQKTGLFNEDYRGGEDSEFATRMRANGIGLYVDTKTEVFASFPDSFKASIKSKFNYGRYYYYYYFHKRNKDCRIKCYWDQFGQILTTPIKRLGSVNAQSFIAYYPFMVLISLASFFGFMYQSLLR
jgi:GT2 family glycosyltransferase